MTTIKAGLAGILALAVTAGVASAETKRPVFAGFTPPKYVMTEEMQTRWAELVKEGTGGEIDWEIFTGGALVPATGILDAVATGVAQGGHLVPGYFPSQLPIANIVGDMGSLNPDALVLGAAYADFATHDKVSYDDYLKNNILYGGGTIATPPYNYICRGDLATLADLQGKRVRTPGGGLSRFAESIGMVPVNLPGSEIYTALERGAVDCIAGDLSLIVSYKLEELADSVVMLPLSPSFALALINYNLDYWRGLTDAQRRAHLDATARSMARGYIAFEKQVKEGADLATKSGIKLNEPSADLLAAYKSWVDAGFGGLEEIGKKEYNIADTKAVMDSFAPYVEKWTKLFEGVDRNDEDALTAIIKTNLFDTIDVATFGMK